jgi:hypothetical protein
MVDLSSLAALEPDETQIMAVQSEVRRSQKPLTEQPLFWVALAEGAALVILLAILVIALSG